MSERAAEHVDVGVVVVSHGHARWLPACLRSLPAALAGLTWRVVVVENGDAAATRALAAEGGLAGADLLEVANRGFADANQRGAAVLECRHLLFLNPDTEVLHGRFADLVARLDAEPLLALLGARQVGPDGDVQPTIRRFPSPLRAWAEAAGGDRRGLGERVPPGPRYEVAAPCDWVSGSVMLVRRASFDQVAGFDTGFFLYAEETDLCARLRAEGLQVGYDPAVTVRHDHGAGADSTQAMVLLARAKRRYAERHLGPVARGLYLAGLAAALLRAAAPLPGTAPARRRAARAAVRALLST